MPDYYDIFLSHAWNDGLAHDPTDKSKWIMGFRDKLQEELRNPNVWRLKPEIFVDKEEILSGVIPDHIESALEKTLVFVCLVSPTYWQRPYCCEELATFGRIARNNPLLPDGRGEDRIIPVVIERLSELETDPLGELKYHQLYDEADGRRLFIDRAGEGLKRMGQLAVSVASVLQRIRGKGGPLHGQGGKVFLGFTPALTPMATGLTSELEHFGMIVKPDGPLPEARELLTQLAANDAAECSIAVHGFDNEFDPGEAATPQPEYELARLVKAQSASGFPRKVLIWAPERGEADSRHYRNALAALESNQQGGQVEIHDVPYTEFHPLLFDTLKKIDPAPIWRPREKDQLLPGFRGVYLLRTSSDSKDARFSGFRDWLGGLQNVKLWESADPDQSDPATIRLREEWILDQATAVFAFGSQDSMQFIRQTFRGKLKGWPRASTSLGFYLTVDQSDFDPPKGVVLCSAGSFDGIAAERTYATILASLL
jgi:hypothetical protein